MKKTQKGNVAVLVVVAVILAITVVVISWMIVKKGQTPVQEATVMKPIAKTQPVDETANWQTYTNAKYGFQFKYLPTYTISSDAKADIESVTARKSDSEFSVEVVNGKLETEFIYPPSGEKVKLQEVLVNSDKWYKFISGDGIGSVSTYKIQLNNNTLQVSFPDFREGWSDQPGDNEKYDNVLYSDEAMQKLILSTFKFIDAAADETANWQTYTNAKYGFEIKIPSDWTVKPEDENNEVFFFSGASLADKEALDSRCEDLKIKESDPLGCSRFITDLYFTNVVHYNSGEIQQKESINGVEWVVNEGENAGWQYEAIVNGKQYSFKTMYLPGNKEKLVQILSTFKFIDAAADETVNWQTYRNDQIGIEFKYPGSWILKKYENYEGANILGLYASEPSADNPFSDVNLYYFATLDKLTSERQSIAKSLDDFIMKNESGSFSNMKKISFANTSAWAGTEAGMTGSYVIYAEKNGQIYEIEFSLIVSESELTPINKDIFSTFKFTK